jgi:hypothetical protein
MRWVSQMGRIHGVGAFNEENSWSGLPKKERIYRVGASNGESPRDRFKIIKNL